MNKKTKLFAAATVAVAAFSTSVYATLITYGWETHYYLDAAHTKKVGSNYKHCDGKEGRSGKVTQYSDSVYFLCRQEDPEF